MAHIELAAPVAHIWFFKSLPSRIGTLLDISLKSLEKVLYFEEYIIIEPGLTDLKHRELITEERYQELIEKYGEGKFEVGIGAEIIKKLLSELKIFLLFQLLYLLQIFPLHISQLILDIFLQL
jgi:DNA-directed RNA polymerase subunit beta'